MKFLELSQRSKNPEKTRDFNFFQEYSLDFLERVKNELLPEEQRNPNTIRISVVGTNGKGSTCHYLSYLSQKIFDTVGLYTSPHLKDQLERIKLNGIMVQERELDSILNRLSNFQKSLVEKLSYFELFTIFSFLYFNDKQCNVEIYEAGLGGRLDATKLSNSKYIVLTSVDLDHTEILGKTREEIVLEKLNIATPYARFLFHTIQPTDSIYSILIDFCAKKNIEMYQYSFNKNLDYLTNNQDYARFILQKILEKEKMEDKSITVYSTQKIPFLEGRMEVLSKEPLIVFDIAHNPAGLKMLLSSLGKLYPNYLWDVYFSVLKDKDIKEMVSILENAINLQMVYRILDSSFNREEIQSPKITNIHLEQFKNSCKDKFSKHHHNNILILGSFSLYTYFTQIYV